MIITDTKKLNSAITSIKGRSKTLTKDVDVALRSAIYHRFAHGDNTKLRNLYNGLGRGIRKADIMSYIRMYGAVSWDKTKREFKNVKGRELSLDQCDNLPRFYHLIKDTGNVQFKGEVFVKSTLKKLRGVIEADKLSESEITTLKIGLAEMGL